MSKELLLNKPSSLYPTKVINTNVADLKNLVNSLTGYSPTKTTASSSLTPTKRSIDDREDVYDKDVNNLLVEYFHLTESVIGEASYENKMRRKETVSFRMKKKYDEILDDGFKWRKYGTMNLLNNPHPRCAEGKDCYVRKQVERDEDDPSYCTITYRGVHTCPSNPPEYLKRCLSYCLLFPHGHEFEGDSMVQLWIAEEVIDGEATERLEDKGYLCLQILLSLGYIEQSGLSISDDHLKYKVSEYYANRGSSVDDFLVINKDGFSDISRKPLHLSLPAEKFDCQISKIIQMCQSLRTLLLYVESKNLVKQVPRDLFLSLNLLRTLVLSGTQVSEVPSSVGNLEDLRYFDLSGTLIRELPGVLCDLIRLQTLKLRNCFRFNALPKGMKKLINLRHLDLDIVRQLSYMPKSMGRLVNLQTFKGFTVGSDEECLIGELCRLNNITGSFFISGLENVLNIEEAKMADLKSKSYITKLVLRWEECINAEAEQGILKCLLPHPNLSELEIQYFSGSALPSWMSDPSFTKLNNITLYKCINCSFFPRIENLLSLKYLRIFGMDKVIDIDCMFSSNPEGSSYHLSFPSLEELIIENMPRLKKLTLIGPNDLPCLRHLSIGNCPTLVELPSMYSLVSLKHLQLNNCYKLELLPDMPASLETLIIQDCQKLQEQCRKDEGRDWPKLAHVPNIWIQYRQISPISSP